MRLAMVQSSPTSHDGKRDGGAPAGGGNKHAAMEWPSATAWISVQGESWLLLLPQRGPSRNVLTDGSSDAFRHPEHALLLARTGSSSSCCSPALEQELLLAGAAACPPGKTARAETDRMAVVRRPSDLARTGRLLVQEPVDEESLVGLSLLNILKILTKLNHDEFNTYCRAPLAMATVLVCLRTQPNITGRGAT
ncbi:hypothetical protein ZWY2020_022947 [Hordeum vulgare]|nr:hypothetical protein ZWY2020_022947 [Hordeum vulgare]